MALLYLVDDGLVPSEKLAFVREQPPLERAFEASDARIEFQPIGINKPLLVEIRRVYCGAYPKGRPSRAARQSMLVTSSMKSVAQYDAQPRAVNFLTGPIGGNRSFDEVAGPENGTTLVYYSPALTSANSVITLEVGFNRFDGSMLDSIGDFLKGAGSVPAFVSHGAVLIGAGMAVNLLSDLGERFLETPPVLSVTESIDFISAGGFVPEAGFRVLVNDSFPRELLETLTVRPETGELMDKTTGHIYEGEHPYVTISVDGSEVREYDDFEPTQASAALLSQYFAIRQEGEAKLDVVLDALKLYSDLRFRREADELTQEIARAGDPDKRARLTQQRDAMLANIRSELLRP